MDGIYKEAGVILACDDRSVSESDARLQWFSTLFFGNSELECQ